MKILFWTPYPIGRAASQRFRFEQYFSVLDSKGIPFDVVSFWSESAWAVLYKKGNYRQKTTGLLGGFFSRIQSLVQVGSYSHVFIHREASPIGPPLFEWILYVLQKKIIYDFDDSIWLANTTEENQIVSKLKWHSKVKQVCRWSFVVSCGNKFLYDFAKQYNDMVGINPTTIDTEKLHNPQLYNKLKKQSGVITIGWTGTHSTLKYLNILLPLLESLMQKFSGQLQLLIIADKSPTFDLPFMKFIRWSKETELQDLLTLDIGLMPLENDDWAKGKCGFKALQYMALEIPSVVSDVGINVELIEHGFNGFLCHTLTEWETSLTKLIEDETLRRRIGENGRHTVINHYSVLSNTTNFLNLFG